MIIPISYSREGGQLYNEEQRIYLDPNKLTTSAEEEEVLNVGYQRGYSYPPRIHLGQTDSRPKHVILIQSFTSENGGKFKFLRTHNNTSDIQINYIGHERRTMPTR